MTTAEDNNQPDFGGDGTAQPQQAEKAKGRLESSYYSVISRQTADGKLFFGQGLEVFPGKELPEFASPGTRAYDAKDKLMAGEQFVLICGHETSPRITAIGSYKAIRNPGIIKLHDAGIVKWPLEGRQRFALVFEKPQGKKILENSEAPVYRISEDRLVTSVIEPVLRVLSDFETLNIVHGAINAENIFMSGGGNERAILGECLSSAPSWRQNPLYEVPERAMAQASGRGPGTLSDDLYALGVCVAMMARGQNLVAGKTPEQIVYEKLEEGSYTTIMGRERIPASISEFLRGVLNDDEEQRWTIGAAMQWLEGRRLSPKQARVVLKAARPLMFLENKYWDLRSLSQAFAGNVPAAAAEIEKGQFEVWLKRNFEDKALTARFNRVWDKGKEKDTGPDKLVSSVCMAMDPYGPVRYKGLSLFPAGYGTALAQTVVRGGDIQLYGEIIAQQFFTTWIGQIFEEVEDAATLSGTFEKCRSALAQRMPGYGIERVLYMTNMEVGCLSPVLQNYFVLAPGGLLWALEDVSRRADRPEAILDRHMVAFISVREPKMIDPHFGFVNSHIKGHQVVGIMRTLAAIQRRFSVGTVPGVTNWLSTLTSHAIELLHDRDLRQMMARRINTIKDNGMIASLLEVVDDFALVRDDAQRFSWAQHEYKALTTEKSQIESLIRTRKNFGRATGRQVAMFLSVTLACILVVIYVVMHLVKMI